MDSLNLAIVANAPIFLHNSHQPFTESIYNWYLPASKQTQNLSHIGRH